MLRIERYEYGVVAGYIALGLIMAQIGPQMTLAEKTLGLDAAHIGSLMAMCFGCSLFGMVAGFAFGDRLGAPRFTLMGSVCLFVGLLSAAFTSTVPLLWFSMGVIGVGFGFYQVGVNSLAVNQLSRLAKSKQPGRMAFLQFFFGVGAVVAPLVVFASDVWIGNWRLSYVIILLLGPLVVSVILIRNLKLLEAPHQVNPGNDRPSLSLNPWNPVLWAFMVAGGVYAGLETSTFNWIPYYWDRMHGAFVHLNGAIMVAVFWTAFSLSRLLLGRLVERIGAYRFLGLGSMVIIFAIAMWNIMPTTVWFEILVMVVLASVYGCIIPTLMILMNHAFPGRSATINSAFFILVTVSASLCPLGIGSFVEASGVQIIPVFFGILALLYALCLTILIRLKP